MTISLFFDEDTMDKDLVFSLRARGVDVETANEANMIARSDEEQLDYAISQNRVLCSFNVADFFRIHTECVQSGKAHAGIVVSQQQQYSIGEQMRRLLRLISELSTQEMRNRIEFLGTWE